MVRFSTTLGLAMSWPEVTLDSVDVYLEQEEMQLKAHPLFLKYITPHVVARAKGTITLLEDNANYSIGWVQAVTSKSSYNYYSDPKGYTSWIIPPLVRGPVSDSNGILYPWYGCNREVETFRGPALKNLPFNVVMDDNFITQITWASPADPTSLDSLSYIYRNQTFKVWLVLKNNFTREIKVLRTFSWQAVLSIQVNCSLPVSHRATLASHSVNIQECKPNDTALPKSVMTSPNANEIQTLVWFCV